MKFAQAIPYIVTVLLSGGFLGGIYALLKLRPEAGQIVVTAAQGALIVQSGVIDSLREELAATREDNAQLREENVKLRNRVSALERRLSTLDREVHHPEGNAP